MSTTAHHALQQALVAALQAAPALAGVAVYANRVRSIPQQQPLSVVVRLLGSDGSNATLGVTDWRTTLAVECYAQADTAGGDPAAAVDATLAAVWQCLAPLQPAGLGLIGLDLQPSIGWDYEDGTQPLVCATVRLAATHRTTTTSLQPWA